MPLTYKTVPQLCTELDILSAWFEEHRGALALLTPDPRTDGPSSPHPPSGAPTSSSSSGAGSSSNSGS